MSLALCQIYYNMLHSLHFAKHTTTCYILYTLPLASDKHLAENVLEYVIFMILTTLESITILMHYNYKYRNFSLENDRLYINTYNFRLNTMFVCHLRSYYIPDGHINVCLLLSKMVKTWNKHILVYFFFHWIFGSIKNVIKYHVNCR